MQPLTGHLLPRARKPDVVEVQVAVLLLGPSTLRTSSKHVILDAQRTLCESIHSML